MNHSTTQPTARYASHKRFGDYLFCSGVTAVDASGAALERYDQLPLDARTAVQGLGYDTNQVSVDIYEAPIVV